MEGCGVYELALGALKDVGFPIVVAMWFMYRTDKRLDKMIKLMNVLISKHEGD